MSKVFTLSFKNQNNKMHGIKKIVEYLGLNMKYFFEWWINSYIISCRVLKIHTSITDSYEYKIVSMT